MTKIKICGITSQVEIDFLNRLDPDYIGFVFAKSRRQVTIDQARQLRSTLSAEIKTVGVFVNEDLQSLIALCGQNILDLVQLHGDEDAAYVKALRNSIRQTVIRAVRIQSRQDVIDSQAILADYLLFDTYHKESYGGTGQSFNWNLLAGFQKPFFLAGGLTEKNILSAIQSASPYCVDISSGVETEGKKDPDKTKKIIELVRSVK